MTPNAEKNWKTLIWLLLGFCYGWIIRDDQVRRRPMPTPDPHGLVTRARTDSGIEGVHTG